MDNIFIIYIYFIILFSLGCINAFTSPIYDQKNKRNSENVPIHKAKSSISLAVGAFGARCPEFVKSGLNPPLNWGLMLSNKNCDKQDEDFIRGCSDYNFADKKKLDKCLLILYSADCKQWVNYHFAAFNICGNAIHYQGMPLPTLFF